MYSYEDRIRAVELYIKVGKLIGVTIRQLGSQPIPPHPLQAARNRVNLLLRI